MILERGTLLNSRYRIVEILGQGGMGSVYRAVDENLGLEVAVKDNLFTTEEYARQFRREALILANLRHSNLPRVTDHFVIQGQGQYLVMDYIEGEDLRQRMERVGVLPEEDVIVIGAAVCDALTYLGTRKPPIIHRDIKPGNVKITPHGEIFLVDFGLAKTLVGSQATTTGARAMTPGFSPPEQYGTARTDQRSDVFSLGATLYAALTGATPEDALARAMEQAQLTSIRKHNSKISRRLAAAIEKALEVRPDSRFQSSDEFKLALTRDNTVVRKRDGEYHVAPPPEAARVEPAQNALLPPESREKLALPDDRSPSLIPTSTALDEPEAARPRPRPRRPRTGCWTLLLAGLALLAIGGFWVTRVDPGLAQRAYAAYWPTLSALAGLAPAAAQAPESQTPTPTRQPPTPTVMLEAPASAAAPSHTPTASVTSPPPTDTPTPQPTPLGGGMGEIAFASRQENLSQVYIINSAGQDRRQLTSLPEGACQPDWSPDGKRLVFISPCNDSTDYYPGSAMYIINADGSGLLPLPTLSGGDYDPQWSPDGLRILFTSLRGSGRPQLYVINLEDSAVTALSEKYATDFQGVWSPDGRQIVFISTRTEGQQVWLMDADGQNQKRLSDTRNLLHSRPSWSPDGKQIIYTQVAADNGVPRVVILQMSEDQPDAFRVSDQPMRDAVYSSDGYWIVFEGWQVGGSHNIYLMSATGAVLTAMTDDPALDFDPAWRPPLIP
ncbi:MAG: protein kinase domain-containing protein [Chloroflexota bacterium]